MYFASLIHVLLQYHVINTVPNVNLIDFSTSILLVPYKSDMPYVLPCKFIGKCSVLWTHSYLVFPHRGIPIPNARIDVCQIH